MGRVSKLKLCIVVLIAVFISYQLTPNYQHYVRMKSNNFLRDADIPTSPKTIANGSVKVIANRSVNVTNKQNLYDSIEVWYKNYSSVDRLLNKHEFVFLQDSNVCAENLDVLIFVHSSTRNVWKRALIRKTWASVNRVKNVTVAAVFMLGQTKHAYLQAHISNESKTYGDIVQGNFMDTYRNLTYKHIMALHWVVLRCPRVKVILKVDDDVLIDVFKLTSVKAVAGIRCVVYANYKPFRKRNAKWDVTPKEYPFGQYHDFCSGMAYIISRNSLTQLLEMSKSTRYFWIDDVYVTGVLRRMAGINLERFSRSHRLTQYSGVNDAMFYVGFIKNWTSIWTKILTRYSYEKS